MRGSGRVRLRAALAVSVLMAAHAQAFAQAAIDRAPAATAASYVSVSGLVVYGFAGATARDATPDFEAHQILPAGSQVAPVARPLVERLWRTSATFRRQCARLAEARVLIIVSVDLLRPATVMNAQTRVTHKGGLSAHVHLRNVYSHADEYLAHELEHVLERLDDVDLALAVVDRVHGVHLVEKPDTFETARAVAVGRTVAREARDAR
ncbi:MAG: hypothetical protein ACRD1U_03300 [Vicinamibacterales bacterium]